jgi:TNF receptor-associated protein 1
MIRYLDEQARNHPHEYRAFYAEFSTFIKEGVCHDFQFTDQLSKLLLFESSTLSEGILTSLDDYISRCPPEQKQIYYLVAPTRESALGSPYYEIFQKHGKEVLLLFNTIDDFVMTNIKNFSGAMLRTLELQPFMTLPLSNSNPDILLCSSILSHVVFRSRDGVR